MAQILLTTLADALGGAVPTTAILKARASRVRSDGETVTAPKRVTVRITDGVPEAPVELDESGADWYWTITLSFPTAGAYVTRYVAVPTQDVEWADLVDIDRSTMQPDPGAVPAWEAAVAQVQALIGTIPTEVADALAEQAGKVVQGVGAPIGVVNATVGTLYMDKARTLGASLWRKGIGEGAHGWVADLGDTGWRDISSMVGNGWTGTVRVRRVNGTIDIRIDSLTAVNATSSVPLVFPRGFRLAGSGDPNARGILHTPDMILRRCVAGGNLAVIDCTPADVLYGQIVSTSSDTWPTELPGTAH